MLYKINFLPSDFLTLPWPEDAEIITLKLESSVGRIVNRTEFTPKNRE